MSRVFNYFGQLRLYSLLDLILLLIATRADGQTVLGALFLWVGFLAYLETRHQHTYRAKAPSYIWFAFTLVGLILYNRVEGLLFVATSYLYSLKNKHCFGIIAPFFRGLQNFFLIGGIIGYSQPLTWLAGLSIVIRNTLADMRDIEKDKNEQMVTLPMLWGFKEDIKYLHLLCLLITTSVWWSYAGLPVWILLGVWIIQIATYNVTPR